MKKNEYFLYGLNKHKEIIDEIITDLNASQNDFDIRLMLIEALTNAFIHGNDEDMDKPIRLSSISDGRYVKFEIEDCGTGFGNINISDKVSDEELLDDCGRGLFLIKSIADEIELRNSTLIIRKTLC